MIDEANILKWCRERGSADAYYGRRKAPHYYTGGNRIGGVLIENLTVTQAEAYHVGYDENPFGKKDWGSDYAPETEREDIQCFGN